MRKYIFIPICFIVALLCTSCKRYSKRELTKQTGDVCSYFVIKDQWKNKCGVVNEDNTLIVPIEYDSISNCHGLCSNYRKSFTLGFRVYSKNPYTNEMELHGLYDIFGHLIIPLDNFKYITGYMTKCGVGFKVENANGERGAYNYDGDIIVPLRKHQYIFADTQSDNLYWHVHNGDWNSLADNDGNIIIPPTTSVVEIICVNTEFDERDGYILLSQEDGDKHIYSVYSLNGKCIIPFSRKYSSINGCYSGGRCFYRCFDYEEDNLLAELKISVL